MIEQIGETEPPPKRRISLTRVIVFVIALVIIAWLFYEFPYKGIRAIDQKNAQIKREKNLNMIERIKEAKKKTGICGDSEPEFRTLPVIDPDSSLPDVIVTNGQAFVMRWDRSEWERFKSGHIKDPPDSEYKQYMDTVLGLARDMAPQTKENSVCWR